MNGYAVRKRRAIKKFVRWVITVQEMVEEFRKSLEEGLAP